MKKIIILLLTVLFTMIPVMADLETNLVSYYKADDADIFPNGTLKDNENAHHCEDSGGTITGITGVINEAVEGDGAGNGFWNCGNSFKNSQYTVNIWFNASNGVDSGIFGTADIGNTERLISYHHNLNRLYVEYKNQPGGQGATSIFCPVSVNEDWNMMTVMFDGTNTSLWYNGTECATTAIDYDVSTFSDDWYWASDKFYSQEDTAVDEIAVWSRTLTDQEISDLWNDGAGLARDSFVADIIPPTVSIEYPGNDSVINDRPINFVYQVTDGNPVDCLLLDETNTTLDFDTTVTQGSNQTLTAYGINDGSLTFEVRCNDSFNNVGNDFVLVEVDTLQPVINFFDPFKGIVYNVSETITYDINVSDANLFNSNVTIQKGFDFLKYDTLLYAPLDDNNVTIRNLAGPDGTFSGNASQLRVDAKVGGGASFSEPAEINFGDEFFLQKDNEFTMSAWFKTTSSSFQLMLSKGNESGGYFLGIDGGFVFADIRSEGGIIGRTSTGTYNDGQFHQLTVTYDGSVDVSGLVIYVDGVVVATNVDSNNLTLDLVSGNDFYIGSLENSSIYTGILDEVYILVDDLDSSEVSELYNSTKNPILLESYVEDYNFTEANDAGNLDINIPGLYQVCARSCDAHTNEKLSENFKYVKDGTTLTINDAPIEFVQDGNIKELKITEQYDRLKIQLDLYQADPFTIKLDECFTKVSNSQYFGHYVCAEKNIWFDTMPYAPTLEYDVGGERHIIITPSEKEVKFDSAGELNCGTECAFVDVSVATSFKSVSVQVDDFSFTSDTFVSAEQFEFNITSQSDLVIINSMNIEKLTGGGTNNVYGRVLVDDFVILDEQLRTVQQAGDVGSSGFAPFKISVQPGTHNITQQFRRDGVGSVEISNNRIVVVDLISAHDDLVDSDNDTVLVSHSDTDFVTVFESVEDHDITSRHAHFGKLTVTKDGGGVETADYFFKNVNVSSDESPVFTRAMSDANDVGSIGVGYVGGLVSAHTTTLQARSRGGDVVNVNGSVLEFSMSDNQERTINSFQASNASSNVNSTLILGAGTHQLLNETVVMENGTGMIIGAVSSFFSVTGSALVTMRIVGGDCDEEIERTIFFAPSDIGNAYIYDYCEFSGTDSIALEIDVPVGESLRVIDESLFGFESVILNTTESVLIPLQNEIVSPIEGHIVGQDVFINWSEFEFATSYDVHVMDEFGNLTTLLEGAVSTDTTQNLSGFVTEDYSVVVVGNNSAGSVNNSVDVIIDSSDPVVDLVSPANGTNQTGGLITYAFSIVELSNSSCNLTVNNVSVNSNVFEGTGNFSMDYLTDNGSDPGVFIWSVECRDSFDQVGLSGERQVEIGVEGVFGFFSASTCRSDTGSALLLGIFLVVSMALMGASVVSRIGMLGVFGSLMFLVTSIYVMPCIFIFGFIGVGLGAFGFVWFIYKGVNQFE